MGVAFLAILALFIHFSARVSENANRLKRGRQLLAIGQSIFLYANENGGALPSRLEQLILTQDVPASIFVCGSSNDKPAQDVANLSDGGHQSYIYLGKDRNWRLDANFVIAYESMTHHNEGFNALFGDAHVEFISGANARKVHSELQAGINPPPSYVHDPAAVVRKGRE